MKSVLVCCLIALVITSCKENDQLEVSEQSRSIVGQWLYTERGYSPGGGYITEHVPIAPPQIVSFFPGLTVQTNIQGLTGFKYYRVSETEGNQILTLFKEDPDKIGSTPVENQNTYFISWEGSTLKLRLRGCIEGCHMGFKRISAEKTVE